jgi:hypothetical protein
LKSSQEKLLNLLKPSGREDRKLEALKWELHESTYGCRRLQFTCKHSVHPMKQVWSSVIIKICYIMTKELQRLWEDGLMIYNYILILYFSLFIILTMGLLLCFSFSFLFFASICALIFR